MLFTDTYKTIVNKSQGEFKDKGSKFIALAFEVTTEEGVKSILNEVRKEHYNAAHHCYAYILTPSKQIQKSNDDREPNNTAGKPILRAILSNEVTNTLVIVVRYFGGKLLGVPGLIQAYGEAANEALKAATIVEKIITENYLVTGHYEHENELYKAYKLFGAKIVSHQYNQSTFSSIFEVRKSKALELTENLKEKRLFEIKFLSEQ